MIKKHAGRIGFTLACACVALWCGLKGGLFASALRSAQTVEQYPIVINEVMVENRGCLKADDGGFHGFIELYNTSDAPVALEGFGLSTDAQNPYMWRFPEMTLEPDSFVVVWTSGKDYQAGSGSAHCNFKLRGNDCLVILTSPGHKWRAALLFGDMHENISYGRLPDGGESLFWFDAGTAGARNESEPLAPQGQGQRLSDVSFSLPAGCYKGATALELTHDDGAAEIFYTLDGSEPDRDSLPYAGPIALDVQAAPVVLRARAFRHGYPKSAISTATYFVSDSGTPRYGIPVVSLAIDPVHLFDYETGIYVSGKVYEDWLTTHPEDGAMLGIPANYNQKGKQWERPGHLEFFEPDGSLCISQNIGVRTHGGYSLSRLNKSLRLLASVDYDDRDAFYYDFFPGGAEAYKPLTGVILRNSATDSGYSFFRDAFIQSLAPDSLDTQESQPCIAYINGAYYGIYNIRTLYSARYLADKYGFDEADAVIVTNPTGGIGDEVQEGFAGDEMPYNKLYRFIQTQDMRDASNYAYVQTQIDIDNYIDYNALEIYCGNEDWIANNVRIWRKRTPVYLPGAPYGHDGRWRWLVYDLDRGFGLFGKSYESSLLAQAVAVDSTLWYNPPELTLVLRTLLTNEDFRSRFICRFADLLNSNFSPERALARLDEMEALYLPYVQEHIDRWNLHRRSLENYRSEIERMREYARNRPRFVRQHLQEQFGLSEAVELGVTVTGAGAVKVNSIEPDAYPWSGFYFREFALTLTALPAPGYRFAGWQGDIIADEATIVFHMEGATKLCAAFEQIPDAGGGGAN